MFSEKAKLWGPQCKVIDFNKLVSFTNLHLQKESMNIEEFYSSKANKRTDVDFDDLEKYLRKIKYERKKINVKFGPVKENIRLKRNMLFGSSKYKNIHYYIELTIIRKRLLIRYQWKMRMKSIWPSKEIRLDILKFLIQLLLKTQNHFLFIIWSRR